MSAPNPGSVGKSDRAERTGLGRPAITHAPGENRLVGWPDAASWSSSTVNTAAMTAAASKAPASPLISNPSGIQFYQLDQRTPKTARVNEGDLMASAPSSGMLVDQPDSFAAKMLKRGSDRGHCEGYVVKTGAAGGEKPSNRTVRRQGSK